jgi:hypothetical protein
MTRFTAISLLILALLADSCSTRKNRVEHSNMIPEKELAGLITELYLTDGLLSIPKTSQLYSLSDTLKAHRDVFKKHGYTKEMMDMTLKYYYVKKPKELIKIYDQVLGILSEMQSRYEAEVVQIQSRMANIWEGENSYLLPDGSGIDSASFVLKAGSQGIYYLKYNVTLSPVDLSYNTRPKVYTCHPDSIETGRRHYIKTIEYFNNGLPHNYTLEIRVPEKSNYYIKGWFYDSGSNPDESLRSLRIEKIDLSFIPGLL